MKAIRSGYTFAAMLAAILGLLGYFNVAGLSPYFTLYDGGRASGPFKDPNVFGAFHSGDFTDKVRVPGIGTVPRNVAAICLWTWECAASPRGPNEHARPIGYGVIALAFLLALRD